MTTMECRPGADWLDYDPVAVAVLVVAIAAALNRWTRSEPGITATILRLRLPTLHDSRKVLQSAADAGHEG